MYYPNYEHTGPTGLVTPQSIASMALNDPPSTDQPWNPFMINQSSPYYVGSVDYPLDHLMRLDEWRKDRKDKMVTAKVS